MKTFFYFHGIQGGKTQALDGPILSYVWVFVLYVCLYITPHVYSVLRGQKRESRYPGTGVTDTIIHQVYAGNRTQDFIQQEQP